MQVIKLLDEVVQNINDEKLFAGTTRFYLNEAKGTDEYEKPYNKRILCRS